MLIRLCLLRFLDSASSLLLAFEQSTELSCHRVANPPTSYDSPLGPLGPKSQKKNRENLRASCHRTPERGNDFLFQVFFEGFLSQTFWAPFLRLQEISCQAFLGISRVLLAQEAPVARQGGSHLRA